MLANLFLIMPISSWIHVLADGLICNILLDSAEAVSQSSFLWVSLPQLCLARACTRDGNVMEDWQQPYSFCISPAWCLGRRVLLSWRPGGSCCSFVLWSWSLGLKPTTWMVFPCSGEISRVLKHLCPGGDSGKETACCCTGRRRRRFSPRVGKIP